MPAIQGILQQTMKKFVFDQYKSLQGIGQQINRPMLFISLGNKCRKEMLQFIRPEMERHWPNSFSQSMNDRRIVLCSIDREEEAPFQDQNCLHYCLKNRSGSDSLLVGTEGGRDEEDCREINTLLREAVSAMAIHGNQASKSRVVLLTCVNDPDSCLSGDIMSIARQLCYSKLQCENFTNGLLAAFLPAEYESKEEVTQTERFFRSLALWSDRNMDPSKIHSVYAQFPTKDSPLIAPCNSLPYVYRTYIFDSVDDNNLDCVSNGRRAELLVDSLELESHGDTALQVVGVKPTKLNDEYGIVCAMDPERWSAMIPDVWKDTDDQVPIKDKLISSIPDQESELRRYLNFACVARYYGNNSFNDTLKNLEQKYFGNTLHQFFCRWEESLFEEYEIPFFVLRTIQESKNVEEVQSYEQEISPLLELEIENDPELPDGTKPVIGEVIDIPGLRALLIERYCKLIPNSTKRLLRDQAIRCQEECKRVKDAFLREEKSLYEFRLIQREAEQIQSEPWKNNIPFKRYDGPSLINVNQKIYRKYVSLIMQVIEKRDESSIYALIQFVWDHIEDMHFPKPDEIKETSMSRMQNMTNLLSRQFTIQNGISRGKILTFTSIEHLDTLRILFEAGNLSDIKITNYSE